MKHFLLFTTLLFSINNTNAQYLFSQNLDDCIPSAFCLDCGDIPANYDTKQFEILLGKISESNNLKGISGKIIFQILLDSLGKGCVLSHTDKSSSKITKSIISNLNNFKGWIPAISNNKNESFTSFKIVFLIKDEKINSKIERVDRKSFKNQFDRVENPDVSNKLYNYKNENLKNYKITTWNSKNSELPNNQNDNISIDKNDLVWITIDEGLVRFDGKNFIHSEQNITDKGKYFNYFALSCDNNDIKWVYGTNNIYSYDNLKWTKYDPKIIGFDGAYQIMNISRTNEMFFCADEGLVIYKNGIWDKYDKQRIPELPENKVYTAYRDVKNRLWLGTFKGIIMIDNNNQVTEFEKSTSFLKGRNFTSITEDEEGNVYFGLFKNDKGTEMNSDEGVAVLSKNDKWLKYTVENSGIPKNYTTKVFYDKFEKIIWIATNSVGVVRFDPKRNIWENYHNLNSDIPTSWISDIEQDSKGNLYLGTRQGLVKIEKR
jgi:ligand-binding sensor domain-containing protein